MQPSSPLLAALRTATAPHHRRTEAVIPILDPTLDLVGYATVLRRMLDVLGPLEAALDDVLAAAALPWVDPAIDWRARHKAPLLARDLAALAARGVVPAADDASGTAAWRGEHTPWPDDGAAAVGALYVLEGATLGGQVVLRRVAPRLGLVEATGAAFYTGYGARTGAMWQSFAATVAAWETTHAAEAPAVIAGACRTFDRLTARFAA